jgi:hypothetical protein
LSVVEEVVSVAETMLAEGNDSIGEEDVLDGESGD